MSITSSLPNQATRSRFGPFPSSSFFGVRYSNRAGLSRPIRDVSIPQTFSAIVPESRATRKKPNYFLFADQLSTDEAIPGLRVLWRFANHPSKR